MLKASEGDPPSVRAFPRALIVATLSILLFAVPSAAALPDPVRSLAGGATHGCYEPAFASVEEREAETAAIVSGGPLPYPLPSPSDPDPRPMVVAILDDSGRLSLLVLDIEYGTACYVSHPPTPLQPPDVVSLVWPIVEPYACSVLVC